MKTTTVTLQMFCKNAGGRTFPLGRGYYDEPAEIAKLQAELKRLRREVPVSTFWVEKTTDVREVTKETLDL